PLASRLRTYTLPLHDALPLFERVVVIIDPCLNPDGRDRYATFYRQFGNAPPNASYDAVEHQEPWPGGRSNHYLFDLNRDWAWLRSEEHTSELQSREKLVCRLL